MQMLEQSLQRPFSISIFQNSYEAVRILKIHDFDSFESSDSQPAAVGPNDWLGTVKPPTNQPTFNIIQSDELRYFP